MPLDTLRLPGIEGEDFMDDDDKEEFEAMLAEAAIAGRRGQSSALADAPLPGSAPQAPPTAPPAAPDEEMEWVVRPRRRGDPPTVQFIQVPRRVAREAANQSKSGWAQSLVSPGMAAPRLLTGPIGSPEPPGAPLPELRPPGAMVEGRPYYPAADLVPPTHAPSPVEFPSGGVVAPPEPVVPSTPAGDLPLAELPPMTREREPVPADLNEPAAQGAPVPAPGAAAVPAVKPPLIREGKDAVLVRAPNGAAVTLDRKFYETAPDTEVALAVERRAAGLRVPTPSPSPVRTMSRDEWARGMGSEYLGKGQRTLPAYQGLAVAPTPGRSSVSGPGSFGIVPLTTREGAPNRVTADNARVVGRALDFERNPEMAAAHRRGEALAEEAEIIETPLADMAKKYGVPLEKAAEWKRRALVNRQLQKEILVGNMGLQGPEQNLARAPMPASAGSSAATVVPATELSPLQTRPVQTFEGASAPMARPYRARPGAQDIRALPAPLPGRAPLVTNMPYEGEGFEAVRTPGAAIAAREAGEGVRLVPMTHLEFQARDKGPQAFGTKFVETAPGEWKSIPGKGAERYKALGEAERARQAAEAKAAAPDPIAQEAKAIEKLNTTALAITRPAQARVAAEQVRTRAAKFAGMLQGKVRAAKTSQEAISQAQDFVEKYGHVMTQAQVDTLFKATERAEEKRLEAEQRERLHSNRERGKALGMTRSRRNQMKGTMQDEVEKLIQKGQPFDPENYTPPPEGEKPRPYAERAAEGAAKARAAAQAHVEKKYAADLADIEGEEQAIGLGVDPGLLRLEAQRVGATMQDLLAAIAAVRKGGRLGAAAQKVLDDYGIDLRSL